MHIVNKRVVWSVLWSVGPHAFMLGFPPFEYDPCIGQRLIYTSLKYTIDTLS
jgi:hypothetical protein